MDRSQVCPIDDVLCAWALGNCVAQVSTVMENHFHGCPTCRSRVEGLVKADPRLAALRTADSAVRPKSTPAALAEILRRLDATKAPVARPERKPQYAFLGQPSPEHPDDLGTLDRYRVVDLLGQGGMGMVFRAVDSMLHRSVALKVILPEYAADEKLRARFLGEARAMVAVRSEHVAEVYDCGVTQGVPFLTMELLIGMFLDKKPRPIPLDGWRRIGYGIAKGLADAHRVGLIHRDLKPSNIHLGTDARTNKPTVKIIDFGLARPLDDDRGLTMRGEFLGTPAYMSPEQAGSLPGTDGRTDLYSLGVILYQLATGKFPYQDHPNPYLLMAEVSSAVPLPSVNKYPHGLTPDLVVLVDRLLAKNPAQRPATATEVMNLLRESMGQKGSSMAIPTAVPPRPGSSPNTPAPATHPATQATPRPQPAPHPTPRPQPAGGSATLLPGGGGPRPTARPPALSELVTLLPGTAPMALGDMPTLMPGVTVLPPHSPNAETAVMGTETTLPAVPRVEPVPAPAFSELTLLTAAPPAVPTAPPEQPRKRSRWLWPAVALVVAFAGVGGAFFSGAFNSKSAPTVAKAPAGDKTPATLGDRPKDEPTPDKQPDTESDSENAFAGEPGRPLTAPPADAVPAAVSLFGQSAGHEQRFQPLDLRAVLEQQGKVPANAIRRGGRAVWSLDGNTTLVGTGRDGSIGDLDVLSDFHVYFEAQADTGSEGGIILRRDVRKNPTGAGESASGFCIPIDVTNPRRSGNVTQWRYQPQVTPPVSVKELAASEVVTFAAKKWHQYEVIAIANRITVFVDGHFASFYQERNGDSAYDFRAGRLMFRVESGTVKFRNVSVKNLTTVSPPPDPTPAPTPVTPGPLPVATTIDPFAAGSTWRGVRVDDVPGGVTAFYELLIASRDGDEFAGTVSIAGPSQNVANVTGRISGNAVDWRERHREVSLPNSVVTGRHSAGQLTLETTGQWYARGSNKGTAKLFRVARADEKLAVGEFYSLYTGRDFDNWEPHYSQPKGWKVIPSSGILRADLSSAPTSQKSGHLYTKAEYKDPHVWCRTRIVKDGGNGGVFVRSYFGPGRAGDVPSGCKAFLSTGKVPTGSLENWGTTQQTNVPVSVPIGEWFDLEILARSNRLTVFVNGKETAATTLSTANAGTREGRIALQIQGAVAELEFAGVAVKEQRP